MAPESYQRVRQLFDQTLERPEEERVLFLERACAGNESLFQTVEGLLRAHRASHSFLQNERPAIAHVGRYLIRGELGRGGMGIVYDALDPVIGRSVAVKVIHLNALTAPGEAEFLKERLFREARSAGQLFHPGIVVVLDVGQDMNLAFIAMERVDGPSLQQILASRHRLDFREALDILQQTAAALDYAHQHGVIHRDIKPANIMRQSDGIVKVADFGIAKIMSAQRSTLSGLVMGTPSYMSPEQIEGRPVDGRSDQFSLAVVAYEFLTGQRPFNADSIPTLAHLIVYGSRPSARTANPALPASIDNTFERAFNRSPEERFQTCVELVSTLESAFQRSRAGRARAPSQKPPGLERIGKRTIRASRYLAGLGVLAAALALAFLFVFKNPYTHAKTDSPVTVQPPAPRIAPSVSQFRVDPVSIEAGHAATLSWDVAGSTQVVIDNGVGKVAANGWLVINPAVSTTYVLTASGSGLNTRATVSLDVKPKPDVKPEPLPVAGRAEQLLKAAMAKRGEGHSEDAAALFRQAAELGDTSAMIELGESYRSGEGVTRDESNALLWFRRAAGAGNSSAMVLLGAMYLLGEGTEQDDEAAAQWFQKAVDRNNPAGMYDLATMYEDGRGVSRNAQKAEELYQKAAQLGNTEAQRRLSVLKRKK